MCPQDTNPADESAATLGTREAVIGVASWTVVADGGVKEEELRGVTTALSRMALFKGMDIQDINARFARVFEIAQRDGLDEMMHLAAASIPPELRETTFAIAVDLAFSDGRAHEDGDVLSTVRDALQVEPSMADQIIEVLTIKNQG